MPLLDMPVSDLKNYMGVNPKPADFDAFWEAALDEMRGTDPKPDIRESDFQSPYATCFDMYFNGVGGAKVYAKLLKPKNINGKCPAVIHFHGYTGASEDFVQYLPYAAAGFIVAALDCRGQAGKSQDNGITTGNTHYGHIIRGLDDKPENLLFRSIFLDTAQLAKIVMDMPEVDEERVGAYGGSQGGALTLACAALEPRIKRACAAYPFLSDYKRVWDMDLLEQSAYKELKDHFRRRDPMHKRENEIFTQLGYIDIQNLAPRIKADVVMYTGLMDNICPPSTQFAAYNKMTCKKKVIIYPDFGHEGLPGLNEYTFNCLMGL